VASGGGAAELYVMAISDVGLAVCHAFGTLRARTCSERKKNLEMNAHELTERLKDVGLDSDLDLVAISDAKAFGGYLQTESPRRDPHLSVPDARAIVVAGAYIGGISFPGWRNPSTGRTSRLFLSGFFNDVVVEMNPMAEVLRSEGYRAMICDDMSASGSVAPLKLAAIRAGLGWQGKNSLLVNRRYGTFLALGGIVTDAPLETNVEEEPGRCGNCTKCQDACPVGAIDQAHVLDRTRCLSYLLQQADLPESAARAAGNRVVDCEICQDACPWNAKHIESPLKNKRTMAFLNLLGEDSGRWDLVRLLKLDESGYETTFAGLRTGLTFATFRRNVLNAVKNLKATGQCREDD
jgi:epoxyqueuosine reductase